MDAIAYHLLLQLLKRGDLDQTDIDEMAARLEDEDEHADAHAVRAAPLEASAQSESDWRRSKIRLVATKPDGGNDV